MNFKTPLLLSSILLLTFACSDKSESSGNYSFNKIKALAYDSDNQADLAPVGYTTNKKTETNNQSVQTKKKIIKNGSMTIESDDAAKSKSDLDKSVKKYDGYFEKEDVQNDHHSKAYDLVIRIPAKNFEKLIQSIESGGDEISNKSITADDVTEDFYDVETRLSNKRAYLKRYQELLNKANTIQDILDVEEKIRVLEEEIESAEGRLRFLGDQVGHSTLRLTLFEKKASYSQSEDTFLDRVSKAFGNGWSAIVHFVIALLTLWPFFILAGIAIFIYRRYRRKQKNSVNS